MSRKSQGRLAWISKLNVNGMEVMQNGTFKPGRNAAKRAARAAAEGAPAPKKPHKRQLSKPPPGRGGS